MMIPKKIVIKMKHETGGVAINKVVWLMSKMYLFLLDKSSEHKKRKQSEEKSSSKYETERTQRYFLQ